MKKLYILRHAQKVAQEYENDYDRPLSTKGLEDAQKMSEKLSNKNIKIDCILASPAKRTKETAEIFAKNLNYEKAIVYNEILYMSYVNEMIETISYTYDNVDTLLLVAHNPSVTALALTLVDFKEKMKMGSIMEIEFDCNSWMEISKENARFISYDFPK